MKGIFAIALDGPSASGKSGLAKQIAKRINIHYLSTGLIYRTCAYLYENKYPQLNSRFLLDFVQNLKYDFCVDENEIYIKFNNFSLEKERIFSTNNSLVTSKISSSKVLRDFLLPLQREVAEQYSIVMEGRDISTVVLPQAKYKFFITASAEERARRRLKQENPNYFKQSPEYIKKSLSKLTKKIQERDERDKNRKIAPLKPSFESILIDNTHLSFEESLEKILQYII